MTTAAAPPLPARVLIVGANYWPEESGNAPYTTASAEDLVAHGVHVTVLTAVPHYPQWQVRAGYRGRAHMREWRGGVELVRSWLWVPRRQSAGQRALFEGSFLANALTVRGLRRPDVVVGVTPSLSGAVLARILARRFRVPFGLIVQDLVAPGAVQSGIRGGGWVAGPVRFAERWAFSKASGIGIVSRGFEPYLRDLGVTSGRMTYLPNWTYVSPSTADREEMRARLGWDSDSVVVLHAGAMGLKQGLGQVIEAARLAKAGGSRIRFVLMGDGSERRRLEAEGRGLDNVGFLPPQQAGSYADLLAAADILLISERPGMLNMSLPAKFTSYVAAGRPVVAVVPTEGATAAEIERSGAGLVVPAGRPDMLLAALLDVRSEPERTAEMVSRGKAYARGDVAAERGLARVRDFLSGVTHPHEQKG